MSEFEKLRQQELAKLMATPPSLLSPDGKMKIANHVNSPMRKRRGAVDDFVFTLTPEQQNLVLEKRLDLVNAAMAEFLRKSETGSQGTETPVNDADDVPLALKKAHNIEALREVQRDLNAKRHLGAGTEIKRRISAMEAQLAGQQDQLNEIGQRRSCRGHALAVSLDEAKGGQHHAYEQ